MKKIKEEKDLEFILNKDISRIRIKEIIIWNINKNKYMGNIILYLPTENKFGKLNKKFINPKIKILNYSFNSDWGIIEENGDYRSKVFEIIENKSLTKVKKELNKIKNEIIKTLKNMI